MSSSSGSLWHAGVRSERQRPLIDARFIPGPFATLMSTMSRLVAGQAEVLKLAHCCHAVAPVKVAVDVIQLAIGVEQCRWLRGRGSLEGVGRGSSAPVHTPACCDLKRGSQKTLVLVLTAGCNE